MEPEINFNSSENDTSNIPSYVGLVNQGSTCYLNSVIQALFHLPSFRQTIYYMEKPERDPITLALRNIFSLLHCEVQSVSTEELTQAFGWSSDESWIQHDVHEMMQKLFDSLENICKGTPQENFIRDHFYGELTYITRVVDGSDYTSCRNEGFYDIELLVKDKKTIYESLDQWAEPERIEGVSLEIKKGEPSSIHTIERSQRFVRLPPVLLFHPNRVEFCTETFELTTLRSKWTFPISLDLEPYVFNESKKKKDGTSLETSYELRSIVIHQGAANSGHYFAFVRFDEYWVCFNDKIVSRVSEEDVMQSASGGDLGMLGMQSNERASLLVYVNKAFKHEMLSDAPVPDHIKSIAIDIVKERDRKWKERWENRSFQYFTEGESLIDALDGLPEDQSNVVTISLPLRSSLEDIQNNIAENIGLPPKRIRLWTYKRLSSYGYVYASILDSINYCDRLFVEILPILKDKNDLIYSEEEPFFAPVRCIKDDSLFFYGIVHSREELNNLIEESKESMRCIVCESDISLHNISVNKILPGSNIIICPLSIPDIRVEELLRQRKYIKVDIFLMDRIKGGKWSNMGYIRVDDNIKYTELQQKVYNAISNTIKPLPPSAEYIGFHLNTSFNKDVPSFFALPAYSDNTEISLSQLLHSFTEKNILYFTILPNPLSVLDTMRIVVINIGGGDRPTVFVERKKYTLIELYKLALLQTESFLPPEYINYLKRTINGDTPMLRLLFLSSNRIEREYTNNNDTVLDSQGTYIIDVLAELKPNYSRINVLFCNRRSGETHFGFPINIAVSNTLEETGNDISQRVAQRLLLPTEIEEITRWIVAIKGKSGISRTVGSRDLLKKVLEEINSELDCIIIDRPRSLALDGTTDPQKSSEQSITIRETSSHDLAALGGA